MNEPTAQELEAHERRLARLHKLRLQLIELTDSQSESEAPVDTTAVSQLSHRLDMCEQAIYLFKRAYPADIADKP